MCELIQLHISLGVFDLFCDVLLFPSSVFNPFFSWVLCYLFSPWFPPGLLSGEDLEDKFSCRPL